MIDRFCVQRFDEAKVVRDAGEVSNEGWQPTWPANHIGILPLLPPLVRIDHVLIGRNGGIERDYADLKAELAKACAKLAR